MIRAVVTWLRLVWPPGWIVGLLVVFCLSLVGLSCWIVSRFGYWQGTWPLSEPRMGVVLLACGVYGFYRVCFFHPLLRPAYGAWLVLTPWTSQKPLPNGPIHLVWQDGAALALLYVLAYHDQLSPWAVPLVFSVSYLATLGATFWPLGLKWATYVMAFGLGLAARLIDYPWAAACVLVLIYAALWLALRRALAQFPWPRLEWLEKLIPTGKNGKRASESLGWPFDLLRPEPRAAGIRFVDAALLSLLAAWWPYALLSRVADRRPLQSYDLEGPTFFFSLLTLACILARLAAYCTNYWPPISFWGRVFTLRWIIPSYDQVFVAPICAAGAAVAIPLGLRANGVPETLVLPCAAFAVLFITLAAGPTRRQWFLTGSHRLGLAGVNRNRQEFVEL